MDISISIVISAAMLSTVAMVFCESVSNSFVSSALSTVVPQPAKVSTAASAAAKSFFDFISVFSFLCLCVLPVLCLFLFFLFLFF